MLLPAKGDPTAVQRFLRKALRCPGPPSPSLRKVDQNAGAAFQEGEVARLPAGVAVLLLGETVGSVKQFV